MIISQSGIVDIIPEYNRALRPIFCVSEGDADSRMINLTVKNAGELFTIPEGASVYVAGKKIDNTTFTYECSYSGYIVTFPITEQMSAVSGLVLCEIQIVVAGDPLGSANFCFWVEPSPIENGTTSESDLNIFVQAIADLGGYEFLTDEVAVLSARMDQFARLPDGSLSTAADAELVDIRVMANGETAETAGDAVRTQITEVKESISDLGKVLTQYISSDSAQGHYWRSTPTVVSADTTDAARKTYPSVELKAGTYYFSDIDATFTFVQNADTLAVTKINTLPGYDATEGKVTVDYSFILWVTSASGKQAMFADGVLPTEYLYGVYSVQYNGVDIAEMREEVTGLLSSAPVMRFVYVAPNGSDETGDGSELSPFATIYHANETITDNSELNQYTIKVADGTYTDLQARYAGTTPSSSNLQGVRCKPYVYYEGNISNPSACKILWDGAYGYDKTTYRYDNCGFYKCIFHVESGKTAIRGFTIEASNTRYAQHIECGGYGLGFEWEISDCVFIWHGTPDCIDRTSSPATIGTGSGNYEKGHLLRCKIVNDSGITLGWMNHDSQNRYPNKAVYEGAEIVLESCVFNGGDLRTSVVWRNINGDNTIDGYDRFSVINCIGINSLTYMLSGQSTVCQWRGLIKCSDITNNDFATQGLLQ